MVEKPKRSGDAAGGSSHPRPFGDWPTINLILTDATGRKDYQYDSTTLKGQQDNSAAAGDSVDGKTGGTFEFHTKLTLDQGTLDRVRAELEKDSEDGRRAAYKILKGNTGFDGGGDPGKKMVKAALQGRWYD